MAREGFIRFDRDDYRRLGEESLWLVSDAFRLLINFQFESTGAFEMASWRMSAEKAYYEKLIEVVDWAEAQELTLLGTKGVYGEPLTFGEYTTNPKKNTIIAKEYEVFVLKKDFLEIIKKYVPDLDFNKLNKFFASEWKKEKVQKVTDKDIVQAVALTLWDIYPNMTQADMIDQKAIQIYAGASQIKRDNTLREWLGEIDPRDGDKKPGAKKKLD